MKISTKTRYGLRFMIDLAQSGVDECVSLKDIAERQGISKKYLEQVVLPLVKANLVEVKRGNKGGFKLTRKPNEITLLDIVSASEDGIELLDCLGCAGSCEREDGCASRTVWAGMQKAVTDYLSDLTLEDIAASPKTALVEE